MRLLVLLLLLLPTSAWAARTLPNETFPAAMERSFISDNDDYLRDELDELDANDDGSVDAADQLNANGANCAAGTFPLGVDAAGAAESCTDTTTAAELAAETSDYCESISVLDPTSSSDLKFKKSFAWTVESIDCLATGGTSVVLDIDECNSDGATCTTEIEDTITCGTTNTTDDGTLTDGSIAADNYVQLDLGTVTGTVTELSITVCYERVLVIDP